MARIVFMGTPDFAVPALAELIAAGHDIAVVYTQPPRPAGRGMAPRPSPVARFSAEAGIPVLTPSSLRPDAARLAFADHAADLAVVVAYGLILPRALLAVPRLGCYNLHASLLPRWRGAAPIQRAIMAGDSETGVMVMRMEAGLDTGPVCAAERVPIGQDTVAGEVHDSLAQHGARLIVGAVARLLAGTLACYEQTSEGVTYAAKIEPHEARIRWDRPAAEVHNRIRALSPYPGSWFETLLGGRAERVKVLRSVCVQASGEPGLLIDGQLTVACGTGAVRLTQVQRAGKRPMGGADFLRGFPLGRGTHFS